MITLNTSNIELILLDLGGVLYEIDMQKPYSLFIEYLEKHQNNTTLNLADFYQLQIFHEYERGLINSDLFHEKIRQYFDIEISRNDLKHIWNSMLIGTYPETPEFLEKLVNVPNKLALLSNTNEWHYKQFYPEMQKYLKLFDKTYYSHIIGHAKPDNDCFDFVLKDNSINPNRILYVDDTLTHINAASRLGFNVFHFNHTTNREILNEILFKGKTKISE